MLIIDDQPIEYFKKASAGQRFVAVLIDYLNTGLLSLIPFVGWIAGILYFLFKDSLPFLQGQSVGKKALNIRVVLEIGRIPIIENYGASALRQVTQMIPIFSLIDALMVFSDSRQRFGDRWAGTIVIAEP